MKVRNIVRGGRVSEEKAELARRNRRRGTKEERILWRRLKADKLGGFHFRRQQVIRGFIVDFYCSEASLVVEIDGPGHQDDRDYDRDRDEVLQELGLKVLRFENRLIHRNLSAVLADILEECYRGMEMGEETPPPAPFH